MSQQLTIELPSELYGTLRAAAAKCGKTPEMWATERLVSAARASLPSEDRAKALDRLMQHAGAADLGSATGADNESLDRDLGREYGSSHEGRD